jgi:RNA polymerase sigma factor (sigma-70 family)
VDRIRVVYQPTQWSLVLAAGRGADDPASAAALESLCATYWTPVYAYVRKRGYQAADAQDVTQDFFARLVEKRLLERARPDRGRFRSFLIASVRHFLANSWDRSVALKRGGGVKAVAFAEVERTLASDEASPERTFERRWAHQILDTALGRVRERYVATGHEGAFEILKVALGGGSSSREVNRRIADRLGLSPGAARVAVHRLRQRYRSTLRSVVSETLADPSETDDEIRYLLSLVAPD